MAGKRAAEEQLRKVEVGDDDEDDNEEQSAGTWNRASADVLAQRRIVKISGKKSVSAVDTANSNGQQISSSNPNPFAFVSFSGLKTEPVSVVDPADIDSKPRLHIETSGSAFSSGKPAGDVSSSMGFLAYTNNPFKAAISGMTATEGSSSKSPGTRLNPFSSTSPTVNPFMSFVEKKDDLWKTMSKSETVVETTEGKEGSEEEGNDADDTNDAREFKPTVTYAIKSADPIVTGEEDEELACPETRVKLYRLDESGWVEIGTGPVRVLRSKSLDGGLKDVGRVVMRRESQPGGSGTKVLLNFALTQHVSVDKHGDRAVRIAYISKQCDTDTGDGTVSKSVISTYLLKTKLALVNHIRFIMGYSLICTYF
jgi:hypothetical protein